MRLICDDYDGFYVWVEDHDDNVELSPQFDLESDAIKWQARMKKIFTGHTDDSHKGVHDALE